MIFIQNLLGPFQVEVIFSSDIPGHRDQPFKVVSDHICLGGKRRHHFQFFDFLLCGFTDLIRHLGFFYLAGQFIHLSLRIIHLTQLFLDRFELILKVVFLLAAAHLFFDLLFQLGLEFRDLLFFFHDPDQCFEPHDRFDFFEQFLF